MKRILVPTIAAVLLAPLGTLIGADVEFAGGESQADGHYAIQQVGLLQRVFGSKSGCACQAPSCDAPGCDAPACEKPACGCEAPACGCETACKDPCKNGLLGALRCRMQAKAARRCGRTSCPSCMGCTTPTCGIFSTLASCRVRTYMGGCGCASSCEAPTCCADSCTNKWGSYCYERRPSLLDAMKMAVARIRARRSCSSCTDCSSCGCETPGCTTACTNGCTAPPAGSIKSPFQDDEEQVPPAPEVETSKRPQRLRPLAGGGSKTAMGTGVSRSGSNGEVQVEYYRAKPRYLISRTGHEEEIVPGDEVEVQASVEPIGLESQVVAPAEKSAEISALPTLIRFVK